MWSGLSMCTDRLVLQKHRCCPLVVSNVPTRCFSNSNWGQEYCTALLSVLYWKVSPTDLVRGNSRGNQGKVHLLLLAHFLVQLHQASYLCPPMDATKQSQNYCRCTNDQKHPNQHPASKRLIGPCCLVLQSPWVEALSQWLSSKRMS